MNPSQIIPYLHCRSSPRAHFIYFLLINSRRFSPLPSLNSGEGEFYAFFPRPIAGHATIAASEIYPGHTRSNAGQAEFYASELSPVYARTASGHGKVFATSQHGTSHDFDGATIAASEIHPGHTNAGHAKSSSSEFSSVYTRTATGHGKIFATSQHGPSHDFDGISNLPDLVCQPWHEKKIAFPRYFQHKAGQGSSHPAGQRCRCMLCELPKVPV
jgi:hypothetical protein